MSLANLIIDGNVGNEPETRTFQNGGELTSFRLGHGQGYMDRQSNQWVDQGAMWLSVVPQSNAAKKLIPYIHKGSRVVVSGRLQERAYKDQHGTDRTVLEVRADSISLIPRQQQGQQDGYAQQPYQPPAQQQSQAPADDPWAAPTVTPDSFGGFGGAPEPEF